MKAIIVLSLVIMMEYIDNQREEPSRHLKDHYRYPGERRNSHAYMQR